MDSKRKLPGKTHYSGRRREVTRTSGFTVHPETTGGEFRRLKVRTYRIDPGESVEVEFSIEGHSAGDLLGFGAFFWLSHGASAEVLGGPEKRTLTKYGPDSWNKVGSIWLAPDSAAVRVVLRLVATERAEVAIGEATCGRVVHKHLRESRPVLLRNMYQFAPEAVFPDSVVTGQVAVTTPGQSSGDRELILKSCNRCGRFLPVNVNSERDQLSFSNHCVAVHRRPCRHSSFGRLRNADAASDVISLDFGFQLECRFCKKFEVNAAHNPQRTPAQMKEDGARRRALELLLAELYDGTPQLKYRSIHGTELAEDVWARFGGRCFNCGVCLGTVRKMQLDHTRPLKLFWPLDGSATALCRSCNSEKRDRSPVEFYDEVRLKRLSKVVGVPFAELRKPGPNEKALGLLLSRLDWFFDEFLCRPEMRRVRDGKLTAELVVKALDKVLALSVKHNQISLTRELEVRRRSLGGA